MKISIQVENIRCGGCANSITKKLMAFDSVNSVNVVIDDQLVIIDSNDESEQHHYIEALYAMGYPEQGSVEGITALTEKAKSVVSCAIGKVS